MKKLLLLCSVAFIFACSNENEATTQENSTTENVTTASKPLPTVENATDEMFYQYINSDIYIEVRQLIINFNENLNYLAYGKTENQLFTWIETNLSETNFTSVEQARNQWNHIKSRKSLEISQFQNVYEFIVNAPVDEVVYYLDRWIPNEGGNIATSSCKEKLDKCRNTANQDYKNNLVDAQNDQSGTSKNELYACADLQHKNDIDACTRAYNACK